MIFKTKLYKEYLARRAGLYYDYESHEMQYEVRGAIREINVEAGKLAIIKLVSWLPFIDSGQSYEKAETARWLLLGFKDEKLIEDMTYKEFKKEMKKWKKCGDVV